MKVSLNLAFLFLCLFYFGKVNSQITFERTYGKTGEDEAFSGIETPGGGYLSVGRTVTKSGNPGYIPQKDDEVCVGCDYNLIIIKTNALGEEEWVKIIENQLWEWADFVINDPAGGFVIAGRTESYGAGSFDAFLVKLDSLGNVLWTNTYGGAEEDRAYSVVPDNDGGFLLCGRSKSFSSPWNAYLIKTDSSGQMVWQKNYGGTIYTLGFFANRTEDGGIIISGRTQTSGQTDATLIKTDIDGNIVWQNNYGGPFNDRAYQVVEKNGGGFVFCGSHASPEGTTTMLWVNEVDINGVETGQSLVYGSQGFQWAYEVKKIANGYIIVGRTNSFDPNSEFDMFLLKVNNLLGLEWIKTFGGAGEESGLSVEPTSDGGFFITGWTKSYGDTDFLLIKTDSMGQTCSINFEDNFENHSCEPFTLYPIGSFDSLLWSDGSNNTNLYIDQSGNYSVVGYKEGCAATSESINILMVQHPTVQQIDTSVYIDCFGHFYDAIGTVGFDSYWWSNNDTNSQTRITVPTELFLLQTIDGCTYSSDTLSVFADSSGSINPSVNFVAVDTAYITWETNLLVDFYEFQFSPNDLNLWTALEVEQPQVGLSALECAEIYDFRIRANCYGNYSGFSTTQQFETDICTGVNEDYSSQEEVKIYPNPAKDYLVIEFLEKRPMHLVSIFDSTGKRVVYKYLNYSNMARIDLSNMSKGIYSILIDSNNSVYQSRFSIE
jgi:hypothetical protein